MEKIDLVNFKSIKNKSEKEDILRLIDTISDCFGIPKSVLKKAFEV
jgi:hypothetical protein